MQDHISNHAIQTPWNKGIIMGQKPPLKRSEVWAIRVRLQIAERTRDLAMFNMAIDSKLRACDLVRLRVRDIGQGSRVSKRAIIIAANTTLILSTDSDLFKFLKEMDSTGDAAGD
jgi:hypothetical protein